MMKKPSAKRVLHGLHDLKERRVDRIETVCLGLMRPPEF